MRDGAEYFTQPVPSAQRRYEAMRAYFVDDMPAAQVADRFGYSTASVHQMATLLRGGRMEFFAAAKPGPKGPRKAGRVHDRVLALRADGHSVTEIAAALHAEGTPVSAQTVWTILDAEGIGRLVRDDTGRRGTPARLDPVKATTRSPASWPAGARQPRTHRPDPRRPLSRHPGPVGEAVDRHPADGQVRPPGPYPPPRRS